MTKFQLVKITKANRALAPLTDTYGKRLRSVADVSSLILKGEKEAENFLKKVATQPGHHLLLLDERGQHGSSRDFADHIRGLIEDPAVKQVSLLVGGPYGLKPEERAKADSLWSLSPMVLQGDVAWLVLWEQVYRAFAIIHGSPYHHD